MIQRVVLGDIAFRVKLAKPLNPDSPQARKVGLSLARSINQRLQQASMMEKLRRYAIAAEVLNIHSGSLIVHLRLHADIPCERDMVFVLKAFTAIYPDIRKAVLAVAADIKIVATNVFGATAGVVEAQVEEEALLSPAQVEASLRCVQCQTALRASVPPDAHA